MTMSEAVFSWIEALQPALVFWQILLMEELSIWPELHIWALLTHALTVCAATL